MSAEGSDHMAKLAAAKAKVEAQKKKMESLGAMMGVKTDRLNDLLAQIKALEENSSSDPDLWEKIQNLNKMLEEARKSVQAITPVQIDEIAKYNNPPERIKMGLEALMYLLKGKKLEWEDIRSLMKKPDFTESVLKFNVTKISPKVVQHVKKEYIEKDFWDMEKLRKASKAMGPLGQWLETQIQLAETISASPDAHKALEREANLEALNVELMVGQAEAQEAKMESDEAEKELREAEKELEVAEAEAAAQPEPAPPAPPSLPEEPEAEPEKVYIQLPIHMPKDEPEPIAKRASIPVQKSFGEPVFRKGPPVEGGTQSELSLFNGSYPYPETQLVNRKSQPGVMNTEWIQRLYINRYFFNPPRQSTIKKTYIPVSEIGFGGAGEPNGFFEAGSQTDDFYTFEMLNQWAKRKVEFGNFGGQFESEKVTIPVPLQPAKAESPKPVLHDFGQNVDRELWINWISVISLHMATIEELEHELELRRKAQRKESDGINWSHERPKTIRVEHSQPQALSDSNKKTVLTALPDSKPHEQSVNFSVDESTGPTGNVPVPLELSSAANFAKAVPNNFRSQPHTGVRVSAAVPESNSRPLASARLTTNQIEFHNAYLQAPTNGVTVEKRLTPPIGTQTSYSPMQVRRTVVRTTDTLMDTNQAANYTLPEPQLVSINVAKRVTRSYSSSPFENSGLPQGLNLDKVKPPVIYTDAKTRIVQGDYYQTTVSHPQQITQQAYVRNIVPAQYKVAERVEEPRPSSAFGIAIVNAKDVISSAQGFSTERVISTPPPTFSTQSRVVYGEAQSQFLVDREPLTTSTVQIGKLDPTTQLRFVNHPITQPGYNKYTDPAFSSIHRPSANVTIYKGNEQANLESPSGVKMYKQSQIVDSQQKS